MMDRLSQASTAACAKVPLQGDQAHLQPSIPENYELRLREIVEVGSAIEGYLTRKEMEFLALLAAVPTARGEILEIGSFRGKSTVILAKAAALTGERKIVAVDPLSSPAETDPVLTERTGALSQFRANLEKAGVASEVEFHQQFSAGLAKTWNPNRKLRLLWIDGDHTYRGAKADLDLFLPFLANGAVVAFHDTLKHFVGPTRVFAEEVLLSPHFGPAGICGSIGWSQYLPDRALAQPFLPHKAKLYRGISRLISLVAFNPQPRGFAKLRYKLARSRVPHRRPTPTQWLRQLVTG